MGSGVPCENSESTEPQICIVLYLAEYIFFEQLFPSYLAVVVNDYNSGEARNMIS